MVSLDERGKETSEPVSPGNSTIVVLDPVREFVFPEVYPSGPRTKRPPFVWTPHKPK